ncbi:NAD(P)H-binding protein [Streptomyces sp. NPDC060243]|uniref:NAD(P)H-binding protein n=1 Tax=Streptomyces sp. NPDC060243 TaxID=3347081 RepID=UPI003663E8EA
MSGLPLVVVTGATGAVGRHVVRRLAGTARVRLIVRDADRARALGLTGDGEGGPEVVTADYGDLERLRPAMEGADAVFVVTANPLRPEHDEHIVAAARGGGVRRAVKLSWLAVADPAADDLVARWNRRAEEVLRRSGLDWTVLRMRSPMSNTLAWAATIRAEGVVRAPGGDARTPCVDPRDVADVAVLALTCTGHEGRTYALTGPRPLSPREQAQVLSGVRGTPVTFEELTPEQALANWLRKLPAPVARALAEAAVRRAAGGAEDVEDGVRAVTGRAPGTFETWAADHGDLFR